MAVSKIHQYLSEGRSSETFDSKDLDTYGSLGDSGLPSATNDAAVMVDKIARLCKLWTDAQSDGNEIAAGKIFDMLQNLIND